MTTSRQCLVSPEPEGGADTEQGEGTEHLSWSGQRAGKPVMVTSVTSHSAPCSRSHHPVSEHHARHRPMMKWALGGAQGASGEPLSRKLESREETAPALITSPQHLIKFPYLFLFLSAWVSQSWSSSSPSLFLPCFLFLLSRSSMKSKFGKSYIH